MTEALKLKFDGTISLSTIVTGLGVVVAVSLWAGRARRLMAENGKRLDKVAELIITQGQQEQDIKDLRGEVLTNRAATLENRKLNEEILRRLK